jgi:hypothetical protein
MPCQYVSDEISHYSMLQNCPQCGSIDASALEAIRPC